MRISVCLSVSLLPNTVAHTNTHIYTSMLLLHLSHWNTQRERAEREREREREREKREREGERERERD